MRDLRQRLGRSYARFATNVAVRFPRLWPLVRPLVRKQFDVLAPVWDTMRSPDAFAPVEAALATVDGPVEARARRRHRHGVSGAVDRGALS